MVVTGRRDLVLHADDGLPSLPHAVEDLLVLVAQFGRVFRLLADQLAEGVVLAGIGRDVGQDRQLIDIRVVFGVESLQLRVNGFVSGAGEASIAFIDLGVGISHTRKLVM